MQNNLRPIDSSVRTLEINPTADTSAQTKQENTETANKNAPLAELQILPTLSEMKKGDKICFTGDEIAVTTLFKCLMGELKPDGGKYTWGVTTSQTFFPKDNAEYFKNGELMLVDWLRQFSTEQSETFTTIP